MALTYRHWWGITCAGKLSDSENRCAGTDSFGKISDGCEGAERVVSERTDAPRGQEESELNTDNFTKEQIEKMKEPKTPEETLAFV